MSIKNLASLFHPRSVAVIGASNRAEAIGTRILENVLHGGFPGQVWPVNPNHAQLLEQICYPDIPTLPAAPDIAIIATPAPTVPLILRQLGEKGTKIAVVVAAGLTDKNGLRQAALEASKPFGLRIFGPNVVGLILPAARLNASFVLTSATSGRIGLLSQSGAIVSSLLDWAAERAIGFSQVISLGDMIDVDIGDGIDLLAADHLTSAVIMYVETIVNPRKFISAARAAGRLKPLIAIVPGRHKAAAAAAATHTGGLASNSRVIDAVLKRAGVMRVTALSELFAAAEITADFAPVLPGRVAIVTNGGGTGVLAVDSLLDRGERLASLGAETLSRLDNVLPPDWSAGNPIDVLGDSSADKFAEAIRIVAADRGVDIVLALECPVQAAPPAVFARALVAMADEPAWSGKPLLACLLGGKAALEGRRILRDARIPDYELPDDAIAALHILCQRGRLQQHLTELNQPTGRESSFDRDRAFGIFAKVASEARTMLTETEAKAVLGCYQMPICESVVAKTVSTVKPLALAMLRRHGSIVVKILSRSITHKSDIGGVALNITTAKQARLAAMKMRAAATAAGLGGQIDGYVIQPMSRMDNGIELFLGLSVDQVFGPVVAFGAGGIGVMQIDDIAMGLPPLDDDLAMDMIKATRIARLLQGFRYVPPVNLESIGETLIAVSQIAIDFPFVRALDINPMLAGDQSLVVLDARIEIDLAMMHAPAPNRRLVIRPYPAEWTREIALAGQRFTLRPIRPLDANSYAVLLGKTTEDDLRMRFLGWTKPSNATIIRMTHIDYEREMAFVAVDDTGELVGVARLVIDAGGEWGEFGLLVRSDKQRIGLGVTLLQHLRVFAAEEGLKEVRGSVLASNDKMLGLCRKLGGDITSSRTEPGLKQVRLSALVTGYKPRKECVAP